jgi:hypothetical protein
MRLLVIAAAFGTMACVGSRSRGLSSEHGRSVRKMAQGRAAAHRNSGHRGDHDTRSKPTKNVDPSCGSLLYHAGDLATAESRPRVQPFAALSRTSR